MVEKLAHHTIIAPFWLSQHVEKYTFIHGKLLKLEKNRGFLTDAIYEVNYSL